MDRIILIAQQLVQEGKTPTTALLKARLPNNIPLPMIIQGLKMWQGDPNKKMNIATKAPLFANKKTEMASFDLLLEEKINAQLAPLKTEIEKLKAELKTLKETN